MKTSQLPADSTLYRAFIPRWASAPLSGAGAGFSGGRFNRSGVPALYLSLDAATAIAEYQQASPYLPPLTLVSFLATLPPLVDVRLLDETWDPLWRDWQEEWRPLVIRGIEPASWALSDQVLAASHAGIIFLSAVGPPGISLVLFTDFLDMSRVLAVQDDGRLPRDGSSWDIQKT